MVTSQLSNQSKVCPPKASLPIQPNSLINQLIFARSWHPVIEYIENKYEEFLNAESRVMRRQIADSRVHCCLYFIAPSGHGLKPLDIEFMQRLHDKVNIIPVIAKADTMTPDECNYFKKQVRAQPAPRRRSAWLMTHARVFLATRDLSLCPAICLRRRSFLLKASSIHFPRSSFNCDGTGNAFD